MLRIITLLLLLTCTTNLSAQDSNAIYVEALGNGILGSVNYDFAPIKSNKKFRIRAGIGGVSYPLFIGQINYLLGKEKHFLEVGIGIDIIGIENDNDKIGAFFAPSGAFQYRFEHPNGFLLRVGLAPIFMSLKQAGSANYQQEFRLYPGASLGYAF